MRYKRFSRVVWTFSIPKFLTVLNGNGVFQQPQGLALKTIDHGLR
jgi:hypothetical protein